MKRKYLSPTQAAGRKFIMKNIKGNIFMLNMLRFKDVADYSDFPDLKPKQAISGKEAYQKYIDHTIPFLEKSGGSIDFVGNSSNFLIGPENESWDAILLIKQKSVESFIAFEQNEEYMKGIAHRNAALEDSRLLPINKIDGFIL